MVAHSALTGSNLHEPKGVAAASANTVYRADGAGSGSWGLIGTSNLNTSSIISVNRFFLSGVIADVSTASFIILPLPYAATLIKATCVLGGTIATADSILTFTNSTGPATCGTITITQSGSVEGTTFNDDTWSNTSFSAGSYLKIATDGGSSNAIPLYITVAFDKA